MQLRDKILATVRTGVAAAVGALVAWLAAEHGIVIDEQASTAVIAAAMVAATVLYHVAASWVQRQWPKVTARYPLLGKALGWLVALLLGTAQQPTGYRPPGGTA